MKKRKLKEEEEEVLMSEFYDDEIIARENLYFKWCFTEFVLHQFRRWVMEQIVSMPSQKNPYRRFLLVDVLDRKTQKMNKVYLSFRVVGLYNGIIQMIENGRYEREELPFDCDIRTDYPPFKSFVEKIINGQEEFWNQDYKVLNIKDLKRNQMTDFNITNVVSSVAIVSGFGQDARSNGGFGWVYSFVDPEKMVEIKTMQSLVSAVQMDFKESEIQKKYKAERESELGMQFKDRVSAFRSCLPKGYPEDIIYFIMYMVYFSERN